MPSRTIPSLVLLVEDHAVIAMNTEILLQDIGVTEVRIAGSVEAALALIDETAFDFAILDVNLGEGEDCLPIAQRLLADGVPIAFATGFGEDMALPQAYRDAPMLRKPYSFEDLQRLFEVE